MISTALAAAADAAHHNVPFWERPEVWVAVAFFAVVGFAWKPVGRALCAGLDLRRDKIKARLDEAARLREDAEAMIATYLRKQEEALKEAEEIVAHAKAEAERLAAQAAKDLEDALKRREQAALQRIAQAETDAVREVRNLAVDIAMAATRKVLAESLSAQQAGALVDHAIQQLPGKLH
jgi:F-type H+-transporting ATPase subunit b